MPVNISQSIRKQGRKKGTVNKYKIKFGDWFQAYGKYRNLEEGVKIFQATF